MAGNRRQACTSSTCLASTSPGSAPQNSAMNRSYCRSIAARSHAAPHHVGRVGQPGPGRGEQVRVPASPAWRSTRATSASRSGCALIHRPGPSEPKPAQLSRVRTACRALRSPSGIRAATSSQRPSQFSAADVNE